MWHPNHFVYPVFVTDTNFQSFGQLRNSGDFLPARIVTRQPIAALGPLCRISEVLPFGVSLSLMRGYLQRMANARQRKKFFEIVFTAHKSNLTTC